ncbi:MAG: pantetheine-phosphate adenylyltransferase [Rhodospirillaceae bacterium]|nr:pantetheine-phosphate adenylyltransferase [Rhodospirillaceae bacterium]
MAERVAVYPGTFDPVTTGHLDIIQRATRICDRLVIGIAYNVDKRPLFTPDERAEMVRDEIEAMAGKLEAKAEVQTFAILLTKFVDEVGGSIIVRGLRAVTDFDYEFQMAGMNARLRPDIETVFLMASERHQFIASRLVKEICLLGGDISGFVSPRILTRIEGRIQQSS